MNRSRNRSRKADPDHASGDTTPDRATTPDSREQGSARQQEGRKEAIGALKTCLDLASTILSALPVQAPKAAVDTIKQLLTGLEAGLDL
jgi:hypothetical protein